MAPRRALSFDSGSEVSSDEDAPPGEFPADFFARRTSAALIEQKSKYENDDNSISTSISSDFSCDDATPGEFPTAFVAKRKSLSRVLQEVGPGSHTPSNQETDSERSKKSMECLNNNSRRSSYKAVSQKNQARQNTEDDWKFKRGSSDPMSQSAQGYDKFSRRDDVNNSPGKKTVTCKGKKTSLNQSMPAGLDYSPGKRTARVKVKNRASLNNSEPSGLTFSPVTKNGSRKVKKRASQNKSLTAGLDHSSEANIDTSKTESEQRVSLETQPKSSLGEARKAKKKQASKLNESMPDYFSTTRDAGHVGQFGKNSSTRHRMPTSSPRKKSSSRNGKKTTLHESITTGITISPRSRSDEKRRSSRNERPKKHNSMPNLYSDFGDENDQRYNAVVVESRGHPWLGAYNSNTSLPDHLDSSFRDQNDQRGCRNLNEDIDSCEHSRRTPSIRDKSPSRSNDVGGISKHLSQSNPSNNEDSGNRRANLIASRLSGDFSSSVPDRLGRVRGSTNREQNRSKKRHRLPNHQNATQNVVSSDEEALLEVMPAPQARALYRPETGHFDWNKWRNGQLEGETKMRSKCERRRTIDRVPEKDHSRPKRRQSSGSHRRHSSGSHRRHSSRKIVETSIEGKKEEAHAISSSEQSLCDRAAKKVAQQRSRREMQTTQKDQTHNAEGLRPRLEHRGHQKDLEPQGPLNVEIPNSAPETTEEYFEVLEPSKRETLFETIAVEDQIDPDPSLPSASTQVVKVETVPVLVPMNRQESASNLTASQRIRSGSLTRQDSTRRELQLIATFMETNVISKPKVVEGNTKQLALSASCCAIL